jgi:hypothetical protein
MVSIDKLSGLVLPTHFLLDAKYCKFVQLKCCRKKCTVFNMQLPCSSYLIYLDNHLVILMWNQEGSIKRLEVEFLNFVINKQITEITCQLTFRRIERQKIELST